MEGSREVLGSNSIRYNKGLLHLVRNDIGFLEIHLSPKSMNGYCHYKIKVPDLTI